MANNDCIKRLAGTSCVVHKLFKVVVQREKPTYEMEGTFMSDHNLIIIESSALEHTVYEPTLFTSLGEVSPIVAKPVNGTKVETSQVVTIEIKKATLVLTNVYCIPSLQLDLVSRNRLDGKEISTVI